MAKGAVQARKKRARRASKEEFKQRFARGFQKGPRQPKSFKEKTTSQP